MILLVEQDAAYANRIAGSLRSSGFEVEVVAGRASALASVAERQPSLVVVSGTLPGSRELLARFAARRGGPGSIVILPVTLATESRPEDYEADDILPKPFSDQDLLEVVARRLRAQTAGSTADLGGQLTSADIFGDVLAEVEAEASRSEVPKRTEPPRLEPTPPTPPAAEARRPTKPKPASDHADIDRKLEETLSGVMPELLRDTARRKPKRKPIAPSVDEIDHLLDKTLSSLELPSRPRRPRPPAEPTAQKPAAAPSSPPAPSPPAASASPTASTPAPTPPAAPTPTADSASPSPPAAPAFEAPSFEAPSFDSPPFETPSFETPSFDTPAAQAPPAAPTRVPSFDPIATEPISLNSLADSLDAASPPLEPEPPQTPPPDLLGSPPAAPSAPTASPRLGETPPPSAEFDADSTSHDDFVSAFAFEPPPRLDDAPLPPPAEHQEPEPEPGTGTDGLRETLDGVLQIRGDADEPSPTGDGRPFGDYRLLERVAIGGMAEVWRARRRGVEGFQKTVAIKKILSHLTGSSDFVTMFIDEAKLAAQLSHAHIIQIYDLGKVDDDFFIAMEYVEGKDLRSILSQAKTQGQSVPIGLGLLTIAAVARALDYAHRKRDFEHRELGLVHRDVSPQNVLIGYEGEIKLCDFGIVKAVAKASTTQMGALKGKLQYMSPEQAWGKEVDARSDIFSLGSVFFELLTGEKLFQGDSEIGVLDAVRDCRVRSVRELNPEIPEAVEQIVFKALAKDPDERYQTAGALEGDINELLEREKPTPSQRDLARFMHELFPVDPPASDAAAASLPAPTEPTSGPVATESAVAEVGVAPPSVPAGAPAPAPAEAGTGSKLPWIAAALVLLLALAALGWFFLAPGTEAPSESAPATSIGTGATGDDASAAAEPGSTGDAQAPDEVGTTDGSAPAGPGAGDSATDDPSGGDSAAAQSPTTGASASEPTAAGPAASSPTAAESGADFAAADAAGETDSGDPIQRLIDEELESQRQRLEQDFEAERRRIEAEIERVRREGQDAGDGG
ncbi:MAG: protein kinase [Acidobacteriota bacterium]